MKSFSLKSLTWTRLLTAVCALAMAGMLTGCGVSGYQAVTNRVVVPGGATQSVHVDCPSGKKVLGGGFSIETPDDVRIFTSEVMATSLITAGTLWSTTPGRKAGKLRRSPFAHNKLRMLPGCG